MIIEIIAITVIVIGIEYHQIFLLREPTRAAPKPPPRHRIPAGAPDAAEGRAGLLDHRRRDRGGNAGGVRGVARRLRVQETQEGEGDPSAGFSGAPHSWLLIFRFPSSLFFLCAI